MKEPLITSVQFLSSYHYVSEHNFSVLGMCHQDIRDRNSCLCFGTTALGLQSLGRAGDPVSSGVSGFQEFLSLFRHYGTRASEFR